MDRRSFLSLLAATPLASVLPTSWFDKPVHPFSKIRFYGGDQSTVDPDILDAVTIEGPIIKPVS